MDAAPWSLDELSERTRRALERLQLTQDNGQVTDVPNGRTIRYYATVGLLDRPTAAGRVALYGPRHLAQLVAIKRLQAQGLTLTQVQERLLGLDSDALERLAALPADAADGAAQHQPVAPAVRSRRADDFWSTEPAPPEASAADGADDASTVRDLAPTPAPASVRTRGAAAAQPLVGISLPEGVALSFSSAAPLSNDDIEAVRAALGPVVDTLRARGLLIPTADEPRKDRP